ncbi:MAG: CopD family protein [Rhodospirillales bacterium]|nr:CopD family protein [Rhodospirillales bacterium]
MDNPVWMVLRGLSRGLHLAGYFSAFGAALFGAVIMPVPGLRRLAWGGFAVAVLGGAAWFWLQTADFASARSPSAVLAALPLVAEYTRFGWLTLARLALLLLAVLCAQGRRWRLAAALAGLGVLGESWLGHGAAMTGMEGWFLFACSLAHIGAAAAWLGTLPALALGLCSGVSPMVLAQRYSRLGMLCVAAILVTAFLQYLLLIGRVSAFFNTGYGEAALLKLVLFAALLTLAARNRWRLTPALPASRAALLRAILWETALGVLVLLAAGVLMQLSPPVMAAMAGMAS